MAMKKHYTSDSVLPRRILLGRCGKRPRISSEATNPRRPPPPPPPTEISKLGDDLLVEILIRLPSPRSACRCKPVCSRWRSLISSPCFNSRFVSHHQRLELPPMPTNPHELQSIILGFLPPMPDSVGGSLKVLDCFKDLVLCGFWDVYNRELSRSYLICNPFTKQWIALPLAPRKPEWYFSSASRLVCEPRSSYNLDLGDGQTFVYSEYRFAVVCIYQEISSKVYLKLDVFCSESGEWTNEAFVGVGQHKIGGMGSVSACSGQFFWTYGSSIGAPVSLAVFDPFRLGTPPVCIDTSAFLGGSLVWTTSVCQDALHIIANNRKSATLRPTIWRWEEDGKSWRKQCEGSVNKKCPCCGHEPKDWFEPFLHPYNPEIVFFQCIGCETALLSCDLRREEVEFVANVEGRHADIPVRVFEPRVSCWPAPIPRYEELRVMYNGSYSFWIQSSNEATTPTSDAADAAIVLVLPIWTEKRWRRKRSR